MTTTTIKERPILFSSPMVKAILEGRKTQTRRVVKLLPRKSLYGDGRVHPRVEAIVDRGNGEFGFEASPEIKQKFISTFPLFTIRSPQGRVGDRLWVRETWRVPGDDAASKAPTSMCRGPEDLEFAADFPDGFERDVRKPWRSSIHLPRWASRITLDVTAVRVERLQDITPADIVAEGMPDRPMGELCGVPVGERDLIAAGVVEPDNAIDWYADLWDAINGKGSWDANPWVWAITFNRVTQ